MAEDIRIAVGDVCVGLLIADHREAARVRESYSGFLSQAPPSLIVEVQEEEWDWIDPPQPGAWPRWTALPGGLLRYECYHDEATVDLSARIGQLTRAPGISLENFLRGIFAWLCVYQGGLVVHSCGVVKGGRSYLFFGKSGAGKSTVAKMSRGFTVLSDELVMLKKVNGSFCAQGMPYWGEIEDMPRVNADAPLAGVFQLVKDTKDYIEPVAKARMVAGLLASVPFVLEDPVASRVAADTCALVLDAVTHGCLHFERDGGLWEVIG